MKNNSFVQLDTLVKDYYWKIASIDSDIHSNIYTHIHEAKFVACGMSPYITAYSLVTDKLKFYDYYGKTLLGDIDVFDIGNYLDWAERAPLEITRYLKTNSTNIIVLKGVGICIYDRDLGSMLKKIDTLENSCKLIALKSTF